MRDKTEQIAPCRYCGKKPSISYFGGYVYLECSRCKKKVDSYIEYCDHDKHLDSVTKQWNYLYGARYYKQSKEMERREREKIEEAQMNSYSKTAEDWNETWRFWGVFPKKDWNGSLW